MSAASATNTNQMFAAPAAPQVYAAVNAVKLALAKEGVAKGKTTQAKGNYQYRGVDDIVDACALPMAEAGLCVFQRTVSHRIEEHKSSGGSVLFYCYVECEFDFVASADGSVHTARFVGESFDSGDKSTGKAETYAFRNCLAKTFVIPVNGADADSDRHESPPIVPRNQPRREPEQRREPPPPSAAPQSKPLPTKTSANYEPHPSVPFTELTPGALSAYVAHYTKKLPTVTQVNQRAATEATIEAAQRVLDRRLAEESKSAGGDAP